MSKYLTLLFLIGCGATQPVVRKKTNPIFNKYIQEYEKYAPKSVTTPINFGFMKESYAGTCTKFNDGRREIDINKERWYNFNDLEKEQLIFHELGHCELNRTHKNTDIDMVGETCPSSVMRWMMFNNNEIFECYDFDRDYYISELFNPSVEFLSEETILNNECFHDTIE